MTASQTLFHTVLNLSAQGSLVILAVLALRLVLRRAPKAYSYALWSAALFRLLCPVSFESAFSFLGLLGAEQNPIPQNFGSQPVFTSAPAQSAASVPADVTVNATLIPQPAAPAASVSLAQVLAVLWLAGVALMAVYGLWSLVRLLRRLRAHAVFYKEEGRLRIYRASGLETAFVIGLVRPRVYLPAGLDEQQEAYILAHEAAHLRRGDPVWRGLGYAALCLHWFNPLVWLAFVLSGRDMEMSCDEAVVRRCGAQIKQGYSASLLSLATGKRISVPTPLAFGEGDTAPRIKNILRYKKPALWLAAAIAVLVAVLCLFLTADPRSGGQTGVNMRCSFMDTQRKGYSVSFALPDGWAFVENELPPEPLVSKPIMVEGETIFPVAEGEDRMVAAIHKDGQTVGGAYVGVFSLPGEEALPDRDSTAWHMMAYSYFMLGSMADWNSDYRVVYQTQATEAALTNVYVEQPADGAPGEMVLTHNAVLYMDTNTGAYIKFVLTADATQEDERLALAGSIKFGEGGTATQESEGLPAEELSGPLVSIPDDLTRRLENAVVGGLVPDARAGQTAPALEELNGQTITRPGVVLLGSYPALNTWVYGYYDEEVGPAGVILDVGETQNLYPYAYAYCASQQGYWVTPSQYVDGDNRNLYLCAHTGTDDGLAVQELLAFHVESGDGWGNVWGCYVDAQTVASLYWHSMLTVTSDPDAQKVSILPAGDTTPLWQNDPAYVLARSDPPGGSGTVAAYTCVRRQGYAAVNGQLYAWCSPVLRTADGAGTVYTGAVLAMPVRLDFMTTSDVHLLSGVIEVWDADTFERATQTQASGTQTWLSGTQSSADAVWYADLTHDGVDEAITFDTIALNAHGNADLTVLTEQGDVLWQKSFSTGDAGRGTLALFSDASGDYLLETRQTLSEGMGGYSYTLWELTGPSRMQAKEGSSVTFPCEAEAAAYRNEELNVQRLTDYVQRLNTLWENARLLVTTEPEVAGHLYDEQGRLCQPTTESWHIAGQDERLHYVETMPWAQRLLDKYGWTVNTSAVDGLTARLEAVKELFAQRTGAEAAN